MRLQIPPVLQPLRTSEQGAPKVLSICWSPDGRFLASGSGDKTICLWDTTSAKPLLSLVGHTRMVLCAAWALDGRLLASGSRDHKIHLWDIDTGKMLRSLQRHKEGVWSLAFSHDGRFLTSESADSTIRIWDPVTGIECCAYRFPYASFKLIRPAESQWNGYNQGPF